jgi:hypothetical protein
MKRCYRCGKVVETERTVGRTEPCPHCDADLHCCLNCTFYDKVAHHECREPQAEPVKDKEKGNFCDYFRFKESARAQPGSDASPSVKEKLNQLFKKHS